MRWSIFESWSACFLSQRFVLLLQRYPYRTPLFLPASLTHGMPFYTNFANYHRTHRFYRAIHHGKSYSTTATRNARRAAFERNLNLVAFLNAEDPTATFAMTQVGDGVSLTQCARSSSANTVYAPMCPYPIP